MSGEPLLPFEWLSEHVLQVRVPTPTLPPSFETNTYVIRHQAGATVVDAGTRDEDVLKALTMTLASQGIETVNQLLATHYHRDHTHGLPYLQSVYENAPIYVHERDLPAACAEMSLQTGVFAMQSRYLVGDIDIQVEHRPGHTHGHVHLVIPTERVILVGDHLAGDGSVWIGPPDGHMGNYYTALDAIASSGCQIAGPGHGPALRDAPSAAQALKHRRLGREKEIIELLHQKPLTLREIVDTLYAGQVPESAMWVAVKTVQAHLQHLMSERQIQRKYAGASGFMYQPL